MENAKPVRSKLRGAPDSLSLTYDASNSTRDIVLGLIAAAAQPKAPPATSVPLPAPSSVIAPLQVAAPVQQHEEPIIINDDGPTDVVPCPICNQVVRMVFLNKHLDKNCSPDPFLNRTASGSGDVASFFAPQGGVGNGKPKTKASAANKGPDDRTRIPVLVYDMLNDKKLKEHCRKHSLPETGTRAQLIRRLSEFILRYNANLDSENPKTTKRIVDDVIRWERQLENSRPAPNVGKDKSETNKFDSKAYLSANSQQFAQLTERARGSKITLVPKRRSVAEEDDSGTNEDAEPQGNGADAGDVAEKDDDSVIDLDPEPEEAEETGNAQESLDIAPRQRFFGGQSKTDESPDEPLTKKARCE